MNGARSRFCRHGLCTRAPVACQTGMPDLEHIRAICHANELCRRRSLERGIGKSACVVAWVAPRVRQLGQRSSTRIRDRSHGFFVGIGCRPEVCVLGQRGNRVLPFPRVGARRRNMGVPSTQAVFAIHPGTRKDYRRSGFHWVNKPSKSSRPPAFPKELTQTGAVPSPGVKSTAPVDWRVWGL